MEFAVEDKDSLKTAVVTLGLVYNEGQRRFRGYGQDTQRCDDAITVPNSKAAYEIGVVAKSQGGYELLWDNYNGGKDYGEEGQGLCDFVGQDGKRLYDEYNAAFLTKQYEMDGYTVSRTNEQDGRIVMEAYR
jgi:hypothetical protein